MRLSRELGTIVRPMVAQTQLRDPARYLQEAVSVLTETGRLQGALRVPAAVAPIKITADLRAGPIHCAVTVPAPREGRPATRVNWLVRQLKTAPGHLCIEASTAWQRGRGPARTINQARSDRAEPPYLDGFRFGSDQDRRQPELDILRDRDAAGLGRRVRRAEDVASWLWGAGNNGTRRHRSGGWLRLGQAGGIRRGGGAVGGAR